MNIPQGYKQTELGIIPEDWHIKKLGDLSHIKTGKRNGDEQITNGRYPFFVRSNFIARIDSYSFDGEAILVPGEGGIGNIFHYINGKFDYHQRVYKISNFADILNGKFLYYYLQKYFGIYALSLTVKATVDSLRLPTFQDFTIAIPSNIEEQKGIAEALSDVDALIAALDKKIGKKRLVKQGAMQQLLTGKNRLYGFSDEWTTKKLGNFAKMNSGGTPDSSNSEYYGGDIPFLSISDITSTNKYISRTEKTITEKGLKNSTARIFPIKTIMYAMYASLGKCGIANIPLSCSQAILGITPSKNIDTEYLYYALSYIEETIKEFGQTGTQTNLSKQLVQELELFLPIDIKEQLAIATILSDMDKEIADLEARRDKYKLIKSGMMQKLLIGQIRLIKPLASIIPLAAPETKIREIPLQTHIVAGHIVNTLYQSSGWGRTKLQKTLHLVGYHCQLDFGNEYIRNTAGPDDQVMMNHIDSKFKQYRHVKIEAKKDNDKTRYDYIPTAMIDELEQVYETYPQTIRDAVDSLINKIKKMDLARAEIVSTLYAVWNNRIIKGEQIADDLLLADFYAWSKHKSDFSRDLVLRGLNYMRKEKIIPTGWGKYIDKSNNIK